MKRHSIALAVIGTYVLVLLFFVGCASITGSTSLTPKAQATLILATYKAQIQDLQSLSALPNATAEQKELFKTKQAILVQIKPLLDIYLQAVDSGTTPDPSLQSSINNLINQLVAASGGVK